MTTSVGALVSERVVRGRPVRKIPSYARQKHYPGLFWAATTGTLLPYENRLEWARQLPPLPACYARPESVTTPGEAATSGPGRLATMVRSMGVDDQPRDKGGFYFVVGSRETGPWGHTYRVWTHRTSFYIMPRDPSLAALKFSGHGPDPDHANPGWKLAFVDKQPKVAVLAGEGALEVQRFDGEPVTGGVRRVVRVRVPWYTLDGSLPNGVGHNEIKKMFTGHLVAPPGHWCAADVDFYVSESDPYWPDADDVRSKNAAMGPLRNEAGQVLTAVSHERSIAKFPTPEGAHAIEPMSQQDTIRGLLLSVEQRTDGFAWIVESPASRTAIADLGRYRSPKVDHSVLFRPLPRGSGLPATVLRPPPSTHGRLAPGGLPGCEAAAMAPHRRS